MKNQLTQILIIVTVTLSLSCSDYNDNMINDDLPLNTTQSEFIFNENSYIVSHYIENDSIRFITDRSLLKLRKQLKGVEAKWIYVESSLDKNLPLKYFLYTSMKSLEERHSQAVIDLNSAIDNSLKYGFEKPGESFRTMSGNLTVYGYDNTSFGGKVRLYAVVSSWGALGDLGVACGPSPAVCKNNDMSSIEGINTFQSGSKSTIGIYDKKNWDTSGGLLVLHVFPGDHAQWPDLNGIISGGVWQGYWRNRASSISISAGGN